MLIILCTLFASACDYGETPQHRGEIYALDTLITVTAYGEKGDEGIAAAKSEIRRLEKLFSVTDENSDIFRINASKGEAVEVSSETYELIKKAINMSVLTEGKFEPTVFPIVKLWGFTDKNYRVPEESEIKNALSNVNCENITLLGENRVKVTEGTQLDLGAVAKGYIGDMSAVAMKKAGVESGIISLGGNVKLMGENPLDDSWNVGVNHPENGVAFCKLQAEEGSIVTSGAYQRNFIFQGVTYHHIINPETGYPAESDIESVTVVAKDGSLADGLSTALYVGGSEYAAELRKAQGDFEYIILTKNNELIISQALKGKTELLEGYENIKITYR